MLDSLLHGPYVRETVASVKDPLQEYSELKQLRQSGENMKHRWAALCLVLALSALQASSAGAQSTGTPPPATQRSAGSLQQNVPNPFNPETRIPFAIGLEGNPLTCKDPGKDFRVSLRIYDLLGKLVAVPILQGGGERAGLPVEKVLLRCGEYSAFWDGKLKGTNVEVPSAPYWYVLEVDGRLSKRMMFVSK